MLKIYATEWCPHCRATLEFLKSQDIPFEYVDIEKAPDDVVATVARINGGAWVVPTLEYHGQWRPGKTFNADELRGDLEKMGAI